jgi:hypothetical protein
VLIKDNNNKRGFHLSCQLQRTFVLLSYVLEPEQVQIISCYTKDFFQENLHQKNAAEKKIKIRNTQKYLYPTLMYHMSHNITAKAALKFGSEAWVLKKREEQRLEAAQMKFLRHLL